jgi:Zn/Cd-binding protein ZinT
MKVLITYTERLTYQLKKEVEMTAQQYKDYLQNGASAQLEHELSSECCVDHFQENELVNITFKTIK